MSRLKRLAPYLLIGPISGPLFAGVVHNLKGGRPLLAALYTILLGNPQLKAKRDAAGEVTAPLQSQAGRNNFRYGTGGLNWWKGDQFAESAFWIHS